VTLSEAKKVDIKEIEYKKFIKSDSLKFNTNTVVSFSHDAKYLFLPLNNKIFKILVNDVNEYEEIISIGTETIIMIRVT
jgi:alpha-N-acetylglucosamine transferase